MKNRPKIKLENRSLKSILIAAVTSESEVILKLQDKDLVTLHFERNGIISDSMGEFSLKKVTQNWNSLYESEDTDDDDAVSELSEVIKSETKQKDKIQIEF
jgi:hypothetical protein